MTLRILADDLTGALDSAAAFAGDVPVHLDAPPADDTAPVSVVATATRDVAPEALASMLAPSLAWLRGADVAFKKVDSLLRGNSFAECAWLAREGGFARIIFAPAFPRQGRTTADGRAWVTQPGSAQVQRIAEGSIAEAFSDAFSGLDAPELWVPDVRSDDDLQRIAAMSMQPASRAWLWCGSAGLAQALARVRGLEAATEPLAPAAAPLMLVSASHHAVVRRQWAALGAEMSSDFRMLNLAPLERLAPAEAAALLASQTQALVETAPKPGTLIVVGGDTLRALCRASGALSLRAAPSPRAGWGRARIVGGRWDGVVCHSRSGAFGADDDLQEIVRSLLPMR